MDQDHKESCNLGCGSFFFSKSFIFKEKERKSFMTGKHHLLYGSIVAIATHFCFTQEISFPIIGVAAIGSLAPDLDIPTSTLGQKVKPLSNCLYQTFGHRGAIHSPAILLIPIFLMWLFARENLWNWSYYQVFCTGYLFHLLQDTFTSGGIPWFYPLSKKRIRVCKVKSGHYTEGLTCGMLAICTLWIFIYCLN